MCCCCCCLDRSGSIPPPLLNNFSLSALKNEIEIEIEKNVSLFISISFLSLDLGFSPRIGEHSNTPGHRGNVTHKWLVQPAVSMNASHHSPLYSYYFADAILTSYLMMIFSLALWVGILYTHNKNILSLIPCFQTKKMVVFTSARSFFCYFSTESSRPVDAPVCCLLSVVEMETEPSHTNTQQQRI